MARCGHCLARVSTFMLLCLALERALDITFGIADYCCSNADGGDGGGGGSSGGEAPMLRCGGYAVNDGDSREVLRMLAVRRMDEIRGMVERLQGTAGVVGSGGGGVEAVYRGVYARVLDNLLEVLLAKINTVKL